jgi:chromosome segregation ATPase
MTTETPRTDAYQYADYILNHYDRNSHMDKLCLARSLVERGYGRADKAEAERDEARKDLIKNLQTTGGMPWREWSAECAKETRRADENLERAERAEAELARIDIVMKTEKDAYKSLHDRYEEGVKQQAELEAEVERLKKLLSLEQEGHEATKKLCCKILDSTRTTPSRKWHMKNKKVLLK